jgi:hypothetical protein
MKEYNVFYENTKETKKIQADKPKDAYLKFLDDTEPKNKAVHVFYASVLDGKETKQTFRDHLSDSAKFEAVSSDNLESVLVKLDEINNNLAFFKRFIVLITISLMAILSWTALSATGSWWKWFAFFLAD